MDGGYATSDLPDFGEMLQGQPWVFVAIVISIIIGIVVALGVIASRRDPVKRATPPRGLPLGVAAGVVWPFTIAAIWAHARVHNRIR